MFHDGDLQSGIALAVQQSKAVFCFVHDDQKNSRDWAKTISNDEQVAEAVKANTVALRIAAGSQESKYLSSFCRINAVPTVVIIEKGIIAGVISHTSSDQLKSRVLAQFSLPQSQPATDATQKASSATSVAHDNPSEDSEVPSQAATSSIHEESTSQSIPVPTPTTLNTPLTVASDPAQQQPLTSHDAQVEGSSRQDPTAQRASDERLPTKNTGKSKTTPTRSTPRQDWTRVQRERERQQGEERERIKAQIRHDHAERRRVDEIRKQSSTEASHQAQSSGKSSNLSVVRVQVRTFDGSTLRSTFPNSAGISNQIRPWIDSSVEQTTPYNLKIILTPRPNKTIEAAEEGKSLAELDIAGSCTLVMIPVKGFVESYAPTGSGIVGSTVSGGYNLLSGTIRAVFGGVRSALGLGQADEQQPPSTPQQSFSRLSSGQVRVRTLADQTIEAQKKDQQFYNGNQLNFEPRKDEEGDKSV